MAHEALQGHDVAAFLEEVGGVGVAAGAQHTHEDHSLAYRTALRGVDGNRGPGVTAALRSSADVSYCRCVLPRQQRIRKLNTVRIAIYARVSTTTHQSVEMQLRDLGSRIVGVSRLWANTAMKGLAGLKILAQA